MALQEAAVKTNAGTQRPDQHTQESIAGPGHEALSV